MRPGGMATVIGITASLFLHACGSEASGYPEKIFWIVFLVVGLAMPVWFFLALVVDECVCHNDLCSSDNDEEHECLMKFGCAQACSLTGWDCAFFMSRGCGIYGFADRLSL